MLSFLRKKKVIDGFFSFSFLLGFFSSLIFFFFSVFFPFFRGKNTVKKKITGKKKIHKNAKKKRMLRKNVSQVLGDSIIIITIAPR
jgi:hypothetical protein